MSTDKLILQHFKLQVAIAEKQRDDALGTVKALTDRVEQLKIASFKSNELRGMPIQKLKSLQVSIFIQAVKLIIE